MSFEYSLSFPSIRRFVIACISDKIDFVWIFTGLGGNLCYILVHIECISITIIFLVTRL